MARTKEAIGKSQEIRIMTDRRFIEETFPVRAVSEHSAREKSIRHGHISTLHIWWARRPLASSRAVNYAALIPAPKTNEERNKQKEFIAEFSKWESSLNEKMIEQAREAILKAGGGKAPKVLDPFGGGGSIPLEALRLGCETYSNDYNPVAVLIQKCTLEYPQKFGKPIQRKTQKQFFGKTQAEENLVNPLLEDVKTWGAWVLEEAKKEIEQFYPKDKDGGIPVGYIWARTIPCQNPSCMAEIPLIRQFWLAKKANKKVSLFPYVKNKTVQFKVVGDGYAKMPEGFLPDAGTVSRAVATCLVCGAIVDAKTTRKLFQEEKSGQRMIAVVSTKKGESGKRYRLATDEDMAVFEAAEQALEKKRAKLMEAWGVDPVPDELISFTPSNTMGGTNRILNYNYKAWGDLFNSRQKLALITFVEKVRQAYVGIRDSGNAGFGTRGSGFVYSDEYAKAVVSYLALVIDMSAAFGNNLARWENTSEAIKHLYSRQALPMMWDYVEVFSLSDSSGSFTTGLEYYSKVIEHCSFSTQIHNTKSPYSSIANSSATQLPYPDNFFDAVLTDPPYYDNVPYSYLSDFFYVWLKRTLGDIHPELFSTPLSPKKQEIVAYSNGPGGWEDGKAFFEEMLKKSFQEIHRVLKPDGIAVIVYAHKSTAGWETLINSLLDSGLVITGAWPINTEMASRLLAQETAALASSIYIVARKMKRLPTGFYTAVKDELKTYLNTKLDTLWQEGISGADFFIAAIGSAIEVFGKYEQVLDYEGSIIRADILLSDVREIATHYAVRQILHNGFAIGISDLTRFYVLWRWNFGEAKVPFDEAKKLSMGCNIDITHYWNKGFIQKEKEFIRFLGPQERGDLKVIAGETRILNFDLIDILHQALFFWAHGQRDQMLKVLTDSGFAKNDVFYRVAQAVSESLSKESTEKKWLDGFLAGKERILSDSGRHKNGKLFE